MGKDFAHDPGRATQQGFSLLEVLVAVVILSLAYVAVMQNYSVSLRNVSRIEKSRNGTLASQLALEKMLLDRAPATGNPFLEGSKYKLMFVAIPENGLTTLKLERLYR